MTKEDLLQTRKVIRARHAIYHAESYISLDDFENSNIQLALDILNNSLPKHLKRITFKHFGLHRVHVKNTTGTMNNNHRWVRLVDNSLSFITLDMMAKLFRSLAHQINQSELASSKGKTIDIPPSNTFD